MLPVTLINERSLKMSAERTVKQQIKFGIVKAFWWETICTPVFENVRPDGEPDGTHLITRIIRRRNEGGGSGHCAQFLSLLSGESGRQSIFRVELARRGE
jgi:hypothetical protein